MYKNGVSYITLDRLDFYSEYATKKILEQIYFYDHFHPEKYFKGNEFYIPININVSSDDEHYEDNISWNLLNTEITPEIFSEILVNDEKINDKFITLIAFQIRKGIHYYIYDYFKNIATNFYKYDQEKYFQGLLTDKKTRYSDNNQKKIITFLFDAKLTKLLGKKTKNQTFFDENDSGNLPAFLRNKNENIKLEKIKEEKKKNSKNKNQNIVIIEHDKQSTTIDENEEKE